MPSAPRTPRTPRNIAEAINLHDEVEPLVEALTTEKTKLLGAGGEIDALNKKIAHFRHLITQEAAKQAPETPDQRGIDRLTSVVEDILLPRMEELRVELAKIDTDLAGYAAEIEEAELAITKGMGFGEKPPVHIVTKETALQTAIESRNAEIHQLYERLNMPATLAFEAHVFPTQARIDQFVSEYNNALTNGAVLDFGSLLVLDESTINKMVSAFKLLNKTSTPDPEALATDVKRKLEAYQTAYEAYKQAGLAGNKHDAGRAGHAIYKSVIELGKLPKADEGDYREHHAAYDKRVALIQESHAPAIQAAERSLYEVISDSASREGLVKARTKEVVAAPPAPDPEHPILKELETEAGQRKQVSEILTELCLPLNKDEVGIVFDTLKQEVTANPIVEGRKKRARGQVNAQVDVWVALKQNITFDIGVKKMSDQERDSTVSRLKRIQPTAPHATFIEVLVASMDSTKPLDKRGVELTDTLLGYIDTLPAVKAETDAAKADELMKAALEKLNPVFEGFKKLITGETQQAQAAAGVTDPNLLLKPAREYAQIFADATPIPGGAGGGRAPTGPDPRKAAEASVNAFILSMERATALGEETKKLETERAAILTAAHEGRVAVQAATLAEKNLITQKTKVTNIKTEITRLTAEHASKRKPLVEAWKQAHAAEVSDKKKLLGEREKELRTINAELEAFQTSGEEAAIRARIRTTAEVLNALHTRDMDALRGLSREHHAILDRAEPITIAGRALKGSAFVHALVHAGEWAPLADRRVLSADIWIPEQLRTITRAQFANVAGTPNSATIEDRIRSAYQLAETETHSLRAIANWFAENPYQPQEGLLARFFLPKPQFLSESQELQEKGVVLRDQLTTINETARLQYAELERQATAAQQTGNNNEVQRLLEMAKPISRNQAETDAALNALTNALASPAQTSVKDFYGYALRGLFSSLQSLSKEYVPEKGITNDNGGFKMLQEHLHRVEKTPDLKTIAKIQEIVTADISRGNDYLLHVDTVRRSIENDPKTDITRESTSLKRVRDKEADLLTRQAQKEIDVQAAKTALEDAEAKKIEDDPALKKFDTDHEQALKNADPSSDIASFSQIEQMAKTAKEKLPLADKALREALETLQKTYAAWLEKKTTLLTPTATPTESEKASAQAAKDLDGYVSHFFEQHGAPNDAKKASFETWARGLDAAKKTALLQALAPELYPTP